MSTVRREDKRVELFIIGTSKAGTTSICALLEQHPEITVSTPKEPGYFTDYAFDRMTREAYHACFEGPASNVWLDGSTTYSRATSKKFGGAAERIAAYNPDAKIVYVVRHPLERIPSLWVQHRSEATTRMGTDFNASVRERPDAFIDGSNYQLQLDAYRQRFPAENLRVFFFEDFARDPTAVLDGIVQHVGLEPIAWQSADKTWNAGSKKIADARWLERMRRSRVRRVFPLIRRSSLLRSVAHRLRLRTATPLAKPEWDPETRRWVIEQLREPTAAFLASLGEDRWDVADWR